MKYRRRHLAITTSAVLGLVALGATAPRLLAQVDGPKSDVEGSPVHGVELPRDYRDWRVISVAHEAGMNNDIRAILGNDAAVRAFREGTRPFPDGSVIVRLAWRYESSPRNDAVFPAPQSFVAGSPTNVQVSVKDSRRYAATGGWGYGQFENGRPNTDHALVQSCFACHSKLEKRDDLVFSHWSP